MLVEGEGFEPSKAEPSDLQSDPFDRSGTPPAEPVIISKFRTTVNGYVVPGRLPTPGVTLQRIERARN